MKKYLLKIIVFAILIATAGCFSMESAPMRLSAREQIYLRASNGVPREHVVISNSGWYLFNALPLACGNAYEDAFMPWRFFSNHVNLDMLHNRLTRYAAKNKYIAEDIYVYNDEQVLLTIPGTSLPIPIPYILTYRELQISSVLSTIDNGGGQ